MCQTSAVDEATTTEALTRRVCYHVADKTAVRSDGEINERVVAGLPLAVMLWTRGVQTNGAGASANPSPHVGRRLDWSLC